MWPNLHFVQVTRLLELWIRCASGNVLCFRRTLLSGRPFWYRGTRTTFKRGGRVQCWWEQIKFFFFLPLKNIEKGNLFNVGLSTSWSTGAFFHPILTFSTVGDKWVSVLENSWIPRNHTVSRYIFSWPSLNKVGIFLAKVALVGLHVPSPFK